VGGHVEGEPPDIGIKKNKSRCVRNVKKLETSLNKKGGRGIGTPYLLGGEEHRHSSLVSRGSTVVNGEKILRKKRENDVISNWVVTSQHKLGCKH